MSIVSKIGLLVAAVGAASWLVVGIWHYNFVAAIFGSGTQSATGGERIIYIVFGAGAIICLPLLAAVLGITARSGSTAEEERAGRARSDASTSRQQAETTEDQQMVVDYQEFKEFQAWRAGKHAQEASAEAGSEEQRAE